MRPGDRIATIKRIETRLGADDNWADIDLTLEQFGFETQYRWHGDAQSYVRFCIKNETDHKLAALDQFLMGHSSPDEEPWEDTRFRLFISHVATKKKVAHELKSHLAYYGIDGFVAHEDIKPGKEWQLVIESALHSCDALVALLHTDFKESNWCDQEVGFALGRGLPVVPINYDLNPYGFFGSVQAIINADAQQMKALARKVVEIFLEDKRTADRLTEAIVERLCESQSYDQANALSRMLAHDTPLITDDQAKRLRKAEKRNGQLQGAFDFESHVSQIEARLTATASPPVGLDPTEEPF